MLTKAAKVSYGNSQSCCDFAYDLRNQRRAVQGTAKCNNLQAVTVMRPEIL